MKSLPPLQFVFDDSKCKIKRIERIDKTSFRVHLTKGYQVTHIEGGTKIPTGDPVRIYVESTINRPLVSE